MGLDLSWANTCSWARLVLGQIHVLGQDLSSGLIMNFSLLATFTIPRYACSAVLPSAMLLSRMPSLPKASSLPKVSSLHNMHILLPSITKSAAWAWLEHRSGPDGRSKPEFDVLRKKFDAKPSRYKAEAVRKIQENSNSSKIDTLPTKSTSSNGYDSLLDRYEIERISRQVHYYIESSRSSRRRGSHRGRRAEAVDAAETKSKRGGKKLTKGLWLGSHVPLACSSSRGEVVDRASIEYSRRRRSSERGRSAVVEVVGCRPRQGIRV